MAFRSWKGQKQEMGIAFQPIFTNLDGFWWDGFDTIIVYSSRAYFFLFFSFLEWSRAYLLYWKIWQTDQKLWRV